MARSSPGVRRMCVGVLSPYPGLFEHACQAGGGTLYTERLAAETLDLGFAAPGADEAVLVQDLIRALQRAAAKAAVNHPEIGGLVLAAFHVGITQVEGDQLRGRAVTRIVELIRELAPNPTSMMQPVGTLIVGITTVLFNDVRSECEFHEDWAKMPASDAWYGIY